MIKGKRSRGTARLAVGVGALCVLVFLENLGARPLPEDPAWGRYALGAGVAFVLGWGAVRLVGWIIDGFTEP